MNNNNQPHGSRATLREAGSGYVQEGSVLWVRPGGSERGVKLVVEGLAVRVA